MASKCRHYFVYSFDWFLKVSVFLCWTRGFKWLLCLSLRRSCAHRCLMPSVVGGHDFYAKELPSVFNLFSLLLSFLFFWRLFTLFSLSFTYYSSDWPSTYYITQASLKFKAMLLHWSPKAWVCRQKPPHFIYLLPVCGGTCRVSQ